MLIRSSVVVQRFFCTGLFGFDSLSEISPVKYQSEVLYRQENRILTSASVHVLALAPLRLRLCLTALVLLVTLQADLVV